MRRMYSRPAQCSALARPSVESGWVTARRSAIVGDDELMHAGADLGRLEPEVLEDRVAVGPGGRGVGDDGAELLLVEPDVARHAGHTVAAQAGVEHVGDRVLAQVRGEQRADRHLLA